MNPLEEVLYKFGRWSNKITSLSMLLNRTDIGNKSWNVKGERTVPTYVTSPSLNPKASRVTPKGVNFVAWRGFDDVRNHRGLWTCVIPFASAHDAKLAIPKTRTELSRNPRYSGVDVEEREIQGLQIDGVPVSFFLEMSATTESGTGTTRVASGSVGHYEFIVVCSSHETDWPWDEVLVLASLQARKIRNVMNARAR